MAFVQRLEVRAPSNAVKNNLGYICVRWSAPAEMDNTVCGTELRRGVVKVEEWNELETLLIMMGSAHLMR